MGDYCLIQDRKASGVNGGTFTAGAWRTRDLNTKLYDPGGFVTLASNQIGLGAGRYRVSASAPATACQSHATRLYNVTTAATVLVGTTEQSTAASSGDAVGTRSLLSGEFV